MSPDPNSSLVRRTIDLNYANKQRSSSLKWIFINGILFSLFTLDLWYKCPGHTSALHYMEACAAAAAGAGALTHALRLRPRRAPARPAALSPRQQRLLGLRDEDLDSSFRVTSPAPTVREPPPGEQEAPASLSPPRAWRAGAGAARVAAAPAPPLALRAVRDEFIADRGALERYLSARDAEEGGGAAAALERASYSPAAGAAPHQLSPLRAEPGAADEAAGGGGAPGATLWRRLHVDPQHLAQFNLNLRRWLHATILARLVREVDECDAALAAAGLEARLGAAAPARLEALAGAAPAGLARRLRALLPFVRPFSDQQYAVERVRALARGGCLGAYRWDGGGARWDAARPTDAELVLHLFAAYMDSVVPGGEAGGAFSAAHVSRAPAPPRGPLALHVASRAPPHVLVALGAAALEVCRGRDNLLHSLLLFLAAAARAEPPALRRLHLGPAGLNMLWILGR